MHSHIPYGEGALLCWRCCCQAACCSRSCPAPPRPASHPAPSSRPVPTAVLLIQAAAAWKEGHAGAVPGSDAERKAFKAALYKQQRHFEGIPLEVKGGWGGC